MSAATTAPANTISTTCSATMTASNACSNKLQSKSACPQGGTETIGHKSTAVCCTVAATTASRVQHSHRPKPPLKPSSECHGQNKPNADRPTTTQQPSTSSSSFAAETSPHVSAKLAKGKHGHKIGQPAEVVDSAGQKNSHRPVAASSCSSSSNSSQVKHGHSVGGHTSTSKLLSTSSKLVTELPNGLVAHATKTCSKTDHLGHTAAATRHGNSTKPLTHLPNGLQVHAGKNCAKNTKHLSQNGSNVQPGSKLGMTEVASGPTEKTLMKNDSRAGEENGHVRVSKSSEACSRSLMDVSGEGRPVNGHNDQAAAAATTKTKKARRKGRGKEALTSVG